MMNARSSMNARGRGVAGVLLIALALLAWSGPAAAADPCKNGWWADFMLGSYHIHPYRHFDEFNPGAGTECWFSPQWAAAGGYFRNSLDRPSFYAGAVYAPELLHWSWFRLTAMGGVISGYNFGKFGLGGENNRTGPVLAPAAMTRFGRFGVNFILIPPIPQDNLPFTVGSQVKYRVH
jgi:hypothetical protein